MRRSITISFVFMFATAVSAAAGVWFTDLSNALSGHSIELNDGHRQPFVLAVDSIEGLEGTFSGTLYSTSPRWFVPVTGQCEVIKDEIEGPLARGRRPARLRRSHYTMTFQTLTGYGWLPVITAYHLDLFLLSDTRSPIRGDGYCVTSRGQRTELTVVFRR